MLAVVRRPDALLTALPEAARRSDRLEVRRADVLDANAVGAALEGASAVVLCLGPTFGEARPVLSEGTRDVIAAMRSRGLRRLVVQGSLPLDGDGRGASRAARLLFRALARMAGPVVADEQGQRAAVEGSGLDWLLVRPVNLTNGPATSRWAATADPRVGALDRVARADVAVVLVAEAAEPTRHGQAVAVLPSRAPAGVTVEAPPDAERDHRRRA